MQKYLGIVVAPLLTLMGMAFLWTTTAHGRHEIQDAFGVLPALLAILVLLWPAWLVVGAIVVSIQMMTAWLLGFQTYAFAIGHVRVRLEGNRWHWRRNRSRGAWLHIYCLVRDSDERTSPARLSLFLAASILAPLVLFAGCLVVIALFPPGESGVDPVDALRDSTRAVPSLSVGVASVVAFCIGVASWFLFSISVVPIDSVMGVTPGAMLLSLARGGQTSRFLMCHKVVGDHVFAGLPFRELDRRTIATLLRVGRRLESRSQVRGLLVAYAFHLDRHVPHRGERRLLRADRIARNAPSNGCDDFFPYLDLEKAWCDVILRADASAAHRCLARTWPSTFDPSSPLRVQSAALMVEGRTTEAIDAARRGLAAQASWFYIDPSEREILLELAAGRLPEWAPARAIPPR